MKIQLVKFDGDWFALLKEDRTNIVTIRRVQGLPGAEYIRHKGINIKVAKLLESEEPNE